MVVEKEKKLNVVILLKVSDKCRYFLKRGVLVFLEEVAFFSHEIFIFATSRP